jgi:hypothetical protein
MCSAGPALGNIHFLTGEQGGDPAFELATARVRRQQQNGFRRPSLLGEIDEPIIPGEGQPVETIGVAVKKASSLIPESIRRCCASA